MDNFLKLFLLFLAAFFFLGCNQNQDLKLSGQIDYTGSSEVYFAKQPIHYKYAPKKQFNVTSDNDGNFELLIPVDSTQVIELYIDDQSYPIVAQPGKKLNLEIMRSHFPDSISIQGYPEPWNEYYVSYREEVKPVQQQINEQISAFRDGEKTEIPELYQKRYQIARKYFQETPLKDIYYSTVGEYLVKRLEEITYRHDQPEFDSEKIRQDILSEAQELNFFSFESLHAQRAGIRDFTNAFANTFGVADSLEEEYGQKLMQYDVKRIGYETLDSARTSVVQHIEGRKARAYSKMHLIAERIGEMPLNIATPSYEEFLEEYSDFPQYTSFLKTFYEQIKRVSPGQPAIPFSIPNQHEEIIEMKDFRGKYVLLDFWASWCIPCLDEFPHMKELYQEYSRDEFEIVAISIEEDSLRWRQALQRFDNPWPQLYGGNSFQQETFKAYRGGGIPFYILVGPKGKIIRYNDARPSFNLPEILDSLITQP
jgi:thiol-disulfide isomerase/thioredoxin